MELPATYLFYFNALTPNVFYSCGVENDASLLVDTALVLFIVTPTIQLRLFRQRHHMVITTRQLCNTLIQQIPPKLLRLRH